MPRSPHGSAPSGTPRLVLHPRGAAHRPAPARKTHGPPSLDTAERERRSHIRRWATFMITHLERAEFEDARHYTYTEALERLEALVARELERVRAQDAA